MTPAFPRSLALAALAALSLAACGGSPPVRYHVLAGDSGPPPAAGGAAMLVEVLPVAVPSRLNRDTIVLSRGPGQPLDLRDSERWAAPLPDEIRQVIDMALWRRLEAADVYLAPPPPGQTALPYYRLALRLDRFEATAGGRAVVEGAWTLRALPTGAVVACRAGHEGAVNGTDTGAAVAALAEGTGRLAGAVAASLERLHRGAADPCASDGAE